jgi:hypothetical protein
MRCFSPTRIRFLRVYDGYARFRLLTVERLGGEGWSTSSVGAGAAAPDVHIETRFERPRSRPKRKSNL